MKSTVFYILIMLSYVATFLSVAWAIISFIVYLAKDIPFQWTSVVSLVVSFIVLALSSFFLLTNGIKNRTGSATKSSFQEKLERKAQERKEFLKK